MNRSKQRKNALDFMPPILHLKGNILPDEAEALSAKLRDAFSNPVHRTPIFVSTMADTTIEYVRYVSPKRMRLLVYGRLKH